jgi:quercetin dioxygenase-like cupin family protein
MTEPTEFPAFLRSLPEADLPFRDAKGWLMQGSGRQVVFIEFGTDCEVPTHSHAEQWEIVLAGRVVLNTEDDSTEYKRGDTFFIPAGVEHSATVHDGYKAVVIFNSPDRYRGKT